jgi:hypothetical protein
VVSVALDIERLTAVQQVVGLAEALAELQAAEQVSAPHCRPVTADEIADLARRDNRFSERGLLVARRDEGVVGWCHVEPPGVARAAGDLYPYVGGEAVFQSGLPHAVPGPGYPEIIRGLLYAACQVRAQQDARHAELFVPDGSWAEQLLRGTGFQPADRWGTYVAPLAGGPIGEARLTVSPLRAADLDGLPVLLSEARLVEGEFGPEDLARLAASFRGFTPQGLLLARRSGAVAGYAAVTIDPAYVSATGRDRAWLAFGPLGMAVPPSGEQQEWLRALARAAAINAFARGATELAFVGGMEGRQPSVWAKLDFAIEVRWRRWRIDL